MLAFGSFHSLAGLDQRAVVDLVAARHAWMKPKFTSNTHNFHERYRCWGRFSLKNEIHRKKAANVRASRNKKESMPTRIKQPSKAERERTKSIISRKFEWELPLIAEFKIHTESRFNRKSTPHFIGFLELTLKHKQAMLSCDKKSSEQSQQLSRKSWEWKNKCRIRLLLLLLSCLCYAVFFVCFARIKHKKTWSERDEIFNWELLPACPVSLHTIHIKLIPAPFACPNPRLYAARNHAKFDE